jgi:hypothetical protein
MLVKKVLNDGMGSIVISILLGLGLAALFRRACKGDRCIVIKAPSLTEVAKHYYKVDADCFKYTPQVVPCTRGGAQGAPVATEESLLAAAS